MNIKKIFILLLLLSLNSVYAKSVEPDVFVQSTVNRASQTLSKNNTKEERIEELKKIALDTVDITGIGFYSLGSHRKNLSDTKISIVLTVLPVSNKSTNSKGISLSIFDSGV